MIAASLLVTACGGGGDGPGPTYSIGGTIAGLGTGLSVSLTNAGGAAVGFSANGAFAVGTVSGNGSYSVTVASQPRGQTCTVSAGSGGSVAANVTSIQVLCVSQPEFAYVGNEVGLSISQYSVTANGSLQPLATPTVASGDISGIAVYPTAQHLYAAGASSSTISQYSIGADGALHPLTPPTLTLGNSCLPAGIAVHPKGGFVYATCAANNALAQFSVKPDGSLASLAPATVATGIAPNAIAIDPAGQHAYV
ncbi:MAG: lactonase family protein, partial [Pseudomonadota bacterium]|nr:lactonase family protein [Pseudomonadota bacterium]